MKAMCGGELDGFCKGMGGLRPCPDHERLIMGEHSHSQAGEWAHGVWHPKTEEPNED